jgi:hypothetical protein
MKVHDLKDAEGRVFAFEVDNGGLGRRGLCRIVRRVPGARIIRTPVLLLSWFRETSFCEFEVEGVRFEANEGAWGDSDRYWIGPRSPGWVPQLAAVRQAFLDHPGVPIWVRAAIVAVFVALLAMIAWAKVFGLHR